MIKVTGHFIKWCIGLVVLFVLTNIILRHYHNVLLLFWLSLALVALLSLFWIKAYLSISVARSSDWVERTQFAYWFLELSYQHRWLIPKVLIEDELVEADSYQNTIQRKTKHAGWIQRPEIKMDIQSEFNFFKLPLNIKSDHDDVLVIPLVSLDKKLESSLSKLLDNHARNLQKLFLLEEEFDYLDTLRPGEPLRRIHWKLSSRQQQFIVSREKPPVRPSVQLQVVLHGEDLDERDRVLDIASFLVTRWQQLGYLLSINEVSVISALEGRKRLATLTKENTTVDFTQLSSKNGLMFITDEVSDGLIKYLESLRNHKGVLSLIVINDRSARAVESLPNIQVLRVSDYV
ncbi:MAG: DUF58 domain-containing protein [Erysipelothrix sp.]|nr:DUF58 domain-containing protein [Erysipelothrix sp.]